MKTNYEQLNHANCEPSEPHISSPATWLGLTSGTTFLAITWNDLDSLAHCMKFRRNPKRHLKWTIVHISVYLEVSV